MDVARGLHLRHPLVFFSGYGFLEKAGSLKFYGILTNQKAGLSPAFWFVTVLTILNLARTYFSAKPLTQFRLAQFLPVCIKSFLNFKQARRRG